MNSTVVVACVSDRRWFDLDAVRLPGGDNTHARTAKGVESRPTTGKAADDGRRGGNFSTLATIHETAGAPPLDWWDANDPNPTPHTDGATMTTTNTVTFHRGDVRDVMAAMPASSVDLLVTSPPFLALRSYLPADHPDKAKEIGSEATPALFLDTMLELTAEWRRLVTPTGSIAVEIGDTYSGSGGAGGDYLDGGMREGQPGFGGSADRQREGNAAHWRQKNADKAGWPLAKSLCGIPTLYAWSLAYGVNLLTGADSPAGRWRIRNLLTWTRPNPPVGALGDKYRPATSFVTVACTSDRRWFDLDAVRGEAQAPSPAGPEPGLRFARDNELGVNHAMAERSYHANGGAPPLDWWHQDWQPLHRLPTAPYHGTHYAAYPIALPRRLIESMCPGEVCAVCGEARRRIVKADRIIGDRPLPRAVAVLDGGYFASANADTRTERTTLGWSDCGHGSFRPGVVFDPFAGSGTTAVAAAQCGRDAILADLDHRNVDLCRRRLAETMLIVNETVDGNAGTVTWTVRHDMPGTKHEAAGQLSMFADEATA